MKEFKLGDKIKFHKEIKENYGVPRYCIDEIKNLQYVTVTEVNCQDKNSPYIRLAESVWIWNPNSFIKIDAQLEFDFSE